MNTKNNARPNSQKNKTVSTIVFGIILTILCLYFAIPAMELSIVVKAIIIISAYKLYERRGQFISAVIVAVLLPTELLAISSAIAVGCCLFTKGTLGKAVIAASSATAFAIAFAINQTEISLYVLLPIPASVALGICAKRKTNRIFSIATVSAVLTTTVLIPIAAWCYKQGFLSSLATFSDGIYEFFNGILKEYIDALKELSASNPNTLDQSVADKLEAISGSVIRAFTAIIPAIIITVTNVASAISNFISSSIRTRNGDYLTQEEAEFLPSPVSACFFIISLVLSMFSIGSSRFMEILSVTMLNLNIILLPMFIAVNFLSQRLLLARRGKPTTARIILTVLLIIYLGGLILYPLAVIGAIKTIKLNKADKNGTNS